MINYRLIKLLDILKLNEDNQSIELTINKMRPPIFWKEKEIVKKLGQITVEQCHKNKILSVIKHIPGHGRAEVDSHLALPKIEAEPTILKKSDFIPFVNLNDSLAAMTGHLLFDQIDNQKPVTISPDIIGNIIRGYIGFQGLLISDDISMAALML